MRITSENGWLLRTERGTDCHDRRYMECVQVVGRVVSDDLSNRLHHDDQVDRAHSDVGHASERRESSKIPKRTGNLSEMSGRTHLRNVTERTVDDVADSFETASAHWPLIHVELACLSVQPNQQDL